MSIKLGMIMEPIETINPAENSNFTLLLEATRRAVEIHLIRQEDIFLLAGKVCARTQIISVQEDENNWFEIVSEQTISLEELDAILLRLDPPFDENYLYTTYLIEQVESNGVLVVNKPQGLRDANEKLFTLWFPECCPPTLVTQRIKLIEDFLQEHRDIIIKPLNGRGGRGVFRVTQQDENKSSIFELSTQYEKTPIMAQRFVKEIAEGDKRILMVDGKPTSYALARIPKSGEIRASVFSGAETKGVKLSKRDEWICKQVGQTLRDKGLIFVGLDIIGDYLTEINVTCPSCIKRLGEYCNLNIAGQLFDYIACKKKKG